ncbi:hypothetical protein QVD99_002791 [Batrachochytrium dendrobatidis]|uniref:Uncharacterized protein n=1 Tax=Batrachochytrium dendrobatidis (strain JEL423) TaxID=403673 RepID=A0A177WKS4_BATDL|nr:hypothetical protein O5D80_007018 [Batrachochytrium dendrobatidis]KAK5671026.1 hypothetical protein QVD99_002791 [Batrachochytrium dendrobatidis]OAJ40284.1 hypothetical protein BDEG_24037 [Batrachochytrium dendrobatidis JEL423]
MQSTRMAAKAANAAAAAAAAVTNSSTPAKSGRGPNFAREEDRLLVSCYMTATEEHSKGGPGQTKEALANRVITFWLERYLIELPQVQHETAQARSSKSLTNRFADLKRDIKFYGGCVALYNENQGRASSGPLCSDAASYIVDKYINTTPIKRIDVVHIAGLWDEFKHYRMFDPPMPMVHSSKRKFDEELENMMDDVSDDGLDAIGLGVSGTVSPDAMLPGATAAALALAHHDRRLAHLAASAGTLGGSNDIPGVGGSGKRGRHNIDDDILTMILDALTKRNEIAAKRLELQQAGQAEKLMFQKLKQWNSIVRQGQRHLIKLMTKRDASTDRSSYDPLIQSATQVLESSIATLQRIQMAGPVGVDENGLNTL